MNITLGMWTLLVGGWVLPSVETPMDQPDVPLAPLGQPAYTPGPAGPTGSPAAQPRLPTGHTPLGSPGGSTRGSSESPRRGSKMWGRTQTTPRTTAETMPPLPPTDPRAASETYPWGPPTANVIPEYGGLRSEPTPQAPPSGYSTPRAPGSGRYARPGVARPGYRPYSTYPSRRSTSRESAFGQRAGVHGPQVTGQKPFANYRQPRGVSPYMQLFRTDTALGTVDNYNTMVRPRLEQQQANRQIGRDIHGLRTSSRVQTTAIQRLDRQTQTLEGISVRQYYMDYGKYYPAFAK